MLDLEQEMTGSSGRPEAKILRVMPTPALNEFKQKLEEASINAFTKKELMKFMIKIETKSQLGTLYNLTQANQKRILEQISRIDQLPISTFEKTMQSEDLLVDAFNREDYINNLETIKNVERVILDDEGDISSKRSEYSIIVREINTVGDALAKMNDNGYNCVFLLGENNKLLGLFSRENLLDKPPFFRLGEVKERIIEVSGDKNITDETAMQTMKAHGINAIPIIDESGFFYGILSLKFNEKNKIANSAVLQLTILNLSLIAR